MKTCRFRRPDTSVGLRIGSGGGCGLRSGRHGFRIAAWWILSAVALAAPGFAADGPPVPDAAPSTAVESVPIGEETPPASGEPQPDAAVAEAAATAEEAGDFTAYDLYVGGNGYGFVFATATDSWVELESVDEILVLLPRLNDPEPFRDLFAGRIDGPRTLEGLGTLTPDFAAFRLNLEYDAALLERVGIDKRTLFPEVPGKFAIQQKTTLRGSSPIGEGQWTGLGINHRTMIGHGARRAEWSGNARLGGIYEPQELKGAADLNRMDEPVTVEAGLLQTAGGEHVNSVDVTGVTISTRSDLIAQDRIYQANDVFVYLSSRALVTITRDTADGPILFSRLLDFGEREIDTTGFPMGRYDLVVTKTFDDGREDVEIIPFHKSRELSPRGRLLGSVTVGLARDSWNGTGVPVAEGHLARRLHRDVEFNLDLGGSEAGAFFGLGARHIRDYEDLMLVDRTVTTADLSFNDDLDVIGYGLTAEISNGDFNLSLAGSHTFEDSLIDDARIRGYRTPGQKRYRFAANYLFSGIAWRPSLEYRATWSRGRGGDARYRYGPQLRLNPWSSRDGRLEVRISHADSESGMENDVSLRLRMELGGGFDVTSTARARREPQTSKASAQTQIGYERPDSRPGRDLRLRASLNADPLDGETQRKRVTGDTELDYQSIGYKAKGFLRHVRNSERRTTFGGEWSAKHLLTEDFEFAATGRTEGEAFAVASIEGSEGLPVVLKVNNAPQAYGESGDEILLALQPHRVNVIEATISLEDPNIVAQIRDPRRELYIYPGNAERMTFFVQRSVIVIGFLVDADGNPIATVEVETLDDGVFTDDSGFLTANMAYDGGESLSFAAGAWRCDIPVSEDEVAGGFIDFGELACTARPGPDKPESDKPEPDRAESDKPESDNKADAGADVPVEVAQSGSTSSVKVPE